MVQISYILKPRWKLFQQHDLRLRTNPDPIHARRMFKLRLKETKRTQKFRLLCFIGMYFSVISSAVVGAVALFADVPWLEAIMGALGSVATALLFVFVAGVFITTRIMSYLEVDLYFFSDESRQARRGARAMKYAEARLKRRIPSQIPQNEGKTATTA